MAHHYGEFYISYDFPKHLTETEQISGSVEQEKSEQKEEVKEAKCSNTTK
tara:strand:+ start:33 stop:182 length:150 start_codon:yes stop_codon:yes gene_type:complete